MRELLVQAKSDMAECPVCGEPSMRAYRTQGGGNPAIYCSTDCRAKAATVRSRHWRGMPYGAYISQRGNALRRGIEWQFTFKSWLEWWGQDYQNRGRKLGALCMARKNDTGPYSPDNCYKQTREGNISDWHKLAYKAINEFHAKARPDGIFVVGLLGFGL